MKRTIPQKNTRNAQTTAMTVRMSNMPRNSERTSTILFTSLPAAVCADTDGIPHAATNGMSNGMIGYGNDFTMFP